MAKRATPICPARHARRRGYASEVDRSPQPGFSPPSTNCWPEDPQHSFLHNDIIYVGTIRLETTPEGPCYVVVPRGAATPRRLRVHHGHACCSSSSTKLPLAHPRAASLAPCAPWPSLLAPGRWTAWRERGMGCNWGTSPRKEGHSMTDRLQEHWSGVLLTAFMVGLLLGSVLVLRLTGH